MIKYQSSCQQIAGIVSNQVGALSPEAIIGGIWRQSDPGALERPHRFLHLIMALLRVIQLIKLPLLKSYNQSPGLTSDANHSNDDLSNRGSDVIANCKKFSIGDSLRFWQFRLGRVFLAA